MLVSASRGLGACGSCIASAVPTVHFSEILGIVPGICCSQSSSSGGRGQHPKYSDNYGDNNNINTFYLEVPYMTQEDYNSKINPIINCKDHFCLHSPHPLHLLRNTLLVQFYPPSQCPGGLPLPVCMSHMISAQSFITIRGMSLLGLSSPNLE